MDWTTTGASNMRHNATDGYRFTADIQNDINYSQPHVSATWRWTTSLPSPHFDRDFDSSYKCHEAEVTSESTSFPSATATYYVNFWWSHWFYIGSGIGWTWDPNGGRLYYSEQLSQPGFYDKWDTVPNETAFVATKLYNYKSQVATPGADDYPCQYDGADSDGTLGAAAAAPASSDLASGFAQLTTEDPGEIRIQPDLQDGLDAYRDKAHALAAALTRSGPARGVVTFTNPLSAEDLAALEELGLKVIAIEAVSEELDGGVRMTFGDAYYPDVWGVMDSLAAEEGATMLGVVAAEVLVPDRSAFKRIMQSDDVYLVDLSREQVLRARPGMHSLDVELNDLYWYVAGWESP